MPVKLYGDVNMMIVVNVCIVLLLVCNMSVIQDKIRCICCIDADCNNCSGCARETVIETETTLIEYNTNCIVLILGLKEKGEKMMSIEQG